MSATPATPDDDDPWAPLPPEKMWQRPGDDHVIGKLPERSSAPTAPSVGQPPAAPPTSAAAASSAAEARDVEASPAASGALGLDPVAAEALAELQQRLAGATPGQSLVAQALRRERRAARLQRAVAGATAPELAALHVQGRDPESEPVVEYSPGPDGRDPREDEEWFGKLPAAEQRRLQAQWRKKREFRAGAERVDRRLGNQRFVAALAVFAAAAVAGTGYLWQATLGAGVLAGLWWRRQPADRLLDPLRAFVCLAVVHGVAIVRYGQPAPMFWMDLILIVSFATLVGFDGEIRRTGGFDRAR